MQGEWKASKAEYVKALEEGKARFGGREKDRLMERLAGARSRFVELTKSSKGVGIVDYAGLTKEAYKTKHGVEAEEDGHTLKPMVVDGKMEMCVLERVQASGHFRFQQQEEFGVTEREQHVDGTEFREGQADTAYEALRKQLEVDHKNMKQAKPEQPQSTASHQARTASEHSKPEVEDESSSDSESSDVAAAKSLLGDFMTKSTAPKKGNKAGTATSGNIGSSPQDKHKSKGASKAVTSEAQTSKTANLRRCSWHRSGSLSLRHLRTKWAPFARSSKLLSTTLSAT